VRPSVFFTAVSLAALLAGATAAPASAASAPADFALGNNAEDQACRAQTRYGRTSAGQRYDVYCGAWERPSGGLTALPAAEAEKALAQLAEACKGEARTLAAGRFQELRQIACEADASGLRRFGLFARAGGRVVYGTAYPADWAPLVHGASVVTGLNAATAAPPPASDTAGLQEIRSVFPDGPPGLSAASNYELLRRRAYEKNAIWSFGAAERDFAELLQAHRRTNPEDVGGEAEIMAEIGLNLSGARRFGEASAMLDQAEEKARAADDPLLVSKVLNYRALHLMNEKRFSEALRTAIRANEARAALLRQQQEGGGAFRISASEARSASDRADRQGLRGLLLRAEGMSEADRAAEPAR
jgi:hypothetical protein